MRHEPDREVTVRLRLSAITACPDGLAPVLCLCCGVPLEIHQPDADLPDRMLATCQSCRAWHLIDCVDGAEPLLALLPDVGQFRTPGPA